MKDDFFWLVLKLEISYYRVIIYLEGFWGFFFGEDFLYNFFLFFSPFNLLGSIFLPFFFSPFQLLGSIFLPFVQSNKLDLQCMDIAQDYIEMLQCMVYLKVFTKMKSETLKFEKPHPK